MGWSVVPALNALRDELDAVFPNRDRSSDGSIGDAAHRGRPSGHNPDDTAGSRPEDVDADAVPEVRARDFDADLNHPTVDMGDVFRFLVGECAAGRVTWIKYLIFDGAIATASSGWVVRRYDGANPHRSHMHVSCKSDAVSESTVAVIGLRKLIERDGDDMNDQDRQMLREIHRTAGNADRYLWQGVTLQADVVDGIETRRGDVASISNGLAERLSAIELGQRQILERLDALNQRP